MSCSYEFPYEISPVPEEVNEELLKHFHGERTGFVQVGASQYFFPNKYQAEAKAYYNFRARADDIWVASFPRSGTTCTQEMVWLIANNFDFDAAKSRLLTDRFPFFEFPLFIHPGIKAELEAMNAESPENLGFLKAISRPGYESLDKINTTSRRFIKTHFPMSLLPPSIMKLECKVIYVVRNPKDVAISYYHLNRLFRTQGYMGDFERFWDYFERGLCPWLPYYSHVNEALHLSNQGNVLLLNYDEIQMDLRGTIEKVARFLDCTVTAENVENLIDHLNINNFRNNPAVNGHEMAQIGILNRNEAGFVRRGGVGEQKEFFENINLLTRANDWISKNHDSDMEKENS